MGHHERAGGAELDREIAIGHRVKRVVAHAVETEFLCDLHAVDRERRARERGASQRQAVDAFAAVGEPLRVAVEHFEVRHQVVRERHRLRDLHMRVARHDGIGVPVREIEQRTLCCLDKVRNLVDRRAQIQPHVGRHLVVARARGMQPLAGIADERGQPALDVHVHVFEIDRPFEAAGADLVADLGEALFDRGKVGGGEDVGRAQHARVRERARDVEFSEAPVEVNGRGKALDEPGHGFAKAPRPRRWPAFLFPLRHVWRSHIIKR